MCVGYKCSLIPGTKNKNLKINKNYNQNEPTQTPRNLDREKMET